jgi:adenylate cyclase
LSEVRVERRLAAILAADVAGYSRLMGQDEAGTLARLRAHRRELIDPKLAEHKGRVVKTTGDGILIEFPSVVEAVVCSVAVQRGMAERNIQVPEDQRIVFRMGVNLGDIIVAEDEDIHGDGVNVAARLEALAEPGGICISRMVQDQVRDKLPYAFEDMGEQSVKNIARPLHVYGMDAPAVAATPLAAVHPVAARRGGGWRFVAAAGLVAAVGVGLGAWWVWPHRGSSPASPPEAVGSPAKPVPRLSILVLPFANMSNDPDQQYFADAVTDDLTTDLSHIVGSFVISRTTAFTYKGKGADVKQIGRDLGVRYVLEGSVQRTGEQVEVNVQLIDAETGAHVWADRFGSDRANLAKAQDEVVVRLARSLQLELMEAAERHIEQEKPRNPDATDFVMRGWAWYYRPNSDANLLEAQKAFERALAIDPQSVDARSGLALVLAEYVANVRKHVVDGVTISREQDLARADQLLREAADRDGNNAKTLMVTGVVRRLQGRFVESKIELERALTLNPNDSGTIFGLGATLEVLGEPAAAVPYFEKVLQISPRWQNIFFVYWWLGTCHLYLSHVDRAVDLYRRANAAKPHTWYVVLYLAAALGLKGDIDEAKAALAEALQLRPESKSALHSRNPPNPISLKLVALQEKTRDVGLRRAGLQ